jgi:septum formation protein
MRAMDFKSIKSYVEFDLPLDCAGSYKLESRGIKLFSKIEGGDHDAIVGLPLMQLQNKLIELGFALFYK